MSVVAAIRSATVKAIEQVYKVQLRDQEILVNETRPEFEGDYTVVLFSFVKLLKKSPDALGQELGEYLLQHNPDLFSSFNVIKGFLNLSVGAAHWVKFLQEQYGNPTFGFQEKTGKKVMV
jgi:arginyl-tRNA synthetase